MKTGTEIINDVFGKDSVSFTRNDLLKFGEIFAQQFRWVKTTDGQDLQFDDLDYEVLRQQKLFYDANRKQVSAVWRDENNKKIVAPIAKLLSGAEGKTPIRYIDGDPFNLKRDNIEIITHQVASYKMKKQKEYSGQPVTSKYKGVSWSKFAKKWCAYIKLENKKKHLGYFTLETDAALAYNRACIENWGAEYSLLNTVII